MIIIKCNAFATTMRSRDQCDNNVVPSRKESRRKYGIQNDDRYNIEGNNKCDDENTLVKNNQKYAQKQNNWVNEDRNVKSQSRIALSNSSSVVVKKMERGISKATENEFLVNEARYKLEKDFGSLGLGFLEVSKSRMTKEERVTENNDDARASNISPYNEDVPDHGRNSWVKDGYEGSSGSSEPANSPTNNPNDGSTSPSKYILGEGKLALNISNFIEADPVYTFILPDLTIYQGKYYIACY